jgi:hypothetical protein
MTFSHWFDGGISTSLPMKKNIAFLASILVLLFSCSDPEHSDPHEIKDPLDDPKLVNTEEISVNLPSGAALDLSNTKLSTGMMTFPVSGQGKSKAVIPDNVRRLAYLFDGSDRLLLMGILDDRTLEISPETTAKALFYLGAGIYYYPDEVVAEFLYPSVELPGYKLFEDKVVAGLKSDILFLDNLKFENDLKVLLDEYANKEPDVDIRARQINVEPTGFLSGIQLFENDPQTVRLANTYRRRAHAFAYKTAFKSKGAAAETVLLPTIPASQTTTISQEIGPTNAFSSTLGTIADQIRGKGIEYARVETDPITLPLADEEEEATYKIRVVGTSLNPNSSPGMTNEELKTWEKLMAKQFFLDFIAPILSEMISEIKGAEDNLGMDAFEAFLAQTPVIWDLIEKGDFKKAAEETLRYLIVDKAGQAFQKELITRVVNRYKNQSTESWIDLDRDYNNSSAIERYAKVIKAVELTVKLLDMSKLTAEIAMSDRINVFTAKAIRSEVKISPREASTVPFAGIPLKAETKTQLTQGQSFVYKWSTTGKYGILTTSTGQKGSTVETSSATVIFRSEVSASNLEEDNIETVTVKVYLKQGTTETYLGEGTSTINVKKVRTYLKPDGISLDGRAKQRVRLYLERSDYVNDIVSTGTLEYKVEWETSGQHGLFDGVNKVATTRGNSMTYQALDGEVHEGTETIIANIYFRQPGQEWVLRERVEGKLKIINDPRKMIINVAVIPKEWILDNRTNGGGYSAGVNAIVPVPVIPNATKYTVKMYGFKKRSSFEGVTVSWMAGGRPPSVYGYPPAGPNDIVGDTYYYTIGRSWCAGNPPGCGSNIPNIIASVIATGGMANVVIDLKD